MCSKFGTTSRIPRLNIDTTVLVKYHIVRGQHGVRILVDTVGYNLPAAARNPVAR